MRGMKASSETGPCDNRQAARQSRCPREGAPANREGRAKHGRRKGGLEAFGFTGGGEALGLADSDIR